MTFQDRQIHIDKQPFSGAHLDDLDFGLVQRHIIAAHQRERLPKLYEPLEFLRRYHGVATHKGELVPTLAGLIVFANDPNQWIDAAGVDVAEFTGEQSRSTNLGFIEQVRGPLFTVIDRVVQILWDRSDHGYSIVGAQREESHSYPQVILRELTVNALCHRDWAVEGSRVRVHLHPDTISWVSPGELPPSLKIEDLLDVQFSRNPALVGLLFQAGYIEGLGLGLDTVFDVLRQGGRPTPEMRSTAHTFTISVAAQPIRRAPQTIISAPERQAAILALVTQHTSCSISDLEQHLGIQRRTIQRDLRVLLEQRQLIVTGATNDRRYHLPSTSTEATLKQTTVNL